MKLKVLCLKKSPIKYADLQQLNSALPIDVNWFPLHQMASIGICFDYQLELTYVQRMPSYATICINNLLSYSLFDLRKSMSADPN